MSKYIVSDYLQKLEQAAKDLIIDEPNISGKLEYLLEKSSGLSHKKVISKKQFAEILVLGYECLNTIIKSRGINNATLKNVNSSLTFDEWLKRAKTVDLDIANIICEFRQYFLTNKLDKEIVDFYIHGSISTLDFIKGYSDFDTLCIIKEDTIASVEKLMQFRDKIVPVFTFQYLIDPLQHHGIFFISETDLKYYNQSFFPLELFNTSTSLFSHEKVSVYVRDDIYDRNKIWIGFGKYFASRQKKDFKTVYDLKHYIQSFLLLPAIYLQIKNNEYYHKKITFDLIKKEFTKDDLSLIDDATNFRYHYKHNAIYPSIIRKHLGLLINPILLHLLHRFTGNYQMRKAKKIIGDNVNSRALELYTKMDEKLKEANQLND